MRATCLRTGSGSAPPTGTSDTAAVTVTVHIGGYYELTDGTQARSYYRHNGDAGWAAELVDDENPAHHYAGFLHTSYFYGPRFAAVMGWFRDGPLSGLSEPDLALGAMAARHASMLSQYFPVSDFDILVRHSLSVEAYAWPPDRPH